MAIENCVDNDFLYSFVDRINVFDYLLSGAREQYVLIKVLPVLLSRALARGFLDVSME